MPRSAVNLSLGLADITHAHQNLQLLFTPSTWNVGVKVGFQCNWTRFIHKVHQMFTNFPTKKYLHGISSQAVPHQDRASDAQVDASNPVSISTSGTSN